MALHGIAGAALAGMMIAGVVLITPGEAFVQFSLEVVQGSEGRDVVIQSRKTFIPVNFYAEWDAEIFEIGDEGVLLPTECKGGGAHSYTWGDGRNIAAFRAPLNVWVGDPDCKLRPGGVYIAEATWKFFALGAERRVTARSPAFIAQ